MVGFSSGRPVRGRPRTFRIALLAGVLLFPALDSWRELHARAVSAPALPAARLPGAGDRVLVFAPHPDDEVLGLGGLLSSSRRHGATIRVAYLTSGDAFRLCSVARTGRWPGADRMRNLALLRRQEARTALARLGIPEEQAVFLGYPDRGLAPMWLNHWDAANPYRSPYTDADRVWAAGSFRPGAPYAGSAALEDIERLLTAFRPDFVYYPDPADDHPDHWAGHCLVQLALERRRPELSPRLHQRTYLIHRGAWPDPMTPDPEGPLAPPGALAGLDARWESLPLSRDAVREKERALAAYSSQQRVAGRFLNAFVRSNELLSAWPVRQAQQGAPQLLPDPTRDRYARSYLGSVDFASLEVESLPNEVRLTARLRRPSVGWVSYRLDWKPVHAAPEALRTRRYHLRGYRCEPENVRFSIQGERLQVLLPRSEFVGSKRLMLSASAWSGPALLDRTPWRVVDVQ